MDFVPNGPNGCKAVIPLGPSQLDFRRKFLLICIFSNTTDQAPSSPIACVGLPVNKDNIQDTREFISLAQLKHELGNYMQAQNNLGKESIQDIQSFLDNFHNSN